MAKTGEHYRTSKTGNLGMAKTGEQERTARREEVFLSTCMKKKSLNI